MSLTSFSKDVRLPIQLQRSMAAEAEATREAKAKVGFVTLTRRQHVLVTMGPGTECVSIR